MCREEKEKNLYELSAGKSVNQKKDRVRDLFGGGRCCGHGVGLEGA